MKAKCKKKSMSPKTLKKLYFGSGPPSPKHQRFTFFLDIEHWTQSLIIWLFFNQGMHWKRMNANMNNWSFVLDSFHYSLFDTLFRM